MASGWSVAGETVAQDGEPLTNEGATLVFRTEFFNMFNHPQFSNPVSVDDSKSTFGQITSSAVNPRLIQFALKYVF